MACFVKTLTRESVKDIEIGNPFLRMKIFSLTGVESKPLTLSDVPQSFRPYPGCIFDVLSEPDDGKRKEAMVRFFADLCGEGCPAQRFSLLYTIMHCWKAALAVSISQPPKRHLARTFEWLIEAGLFQSLMRVLSLCLDQGFLATEYNRYVPYRILETIFVTLQVDMVDRSNVILCVVEDLSVAVSTFVSLMEGRISFAEQLMTQQVMGNLSCFPQGITLLVNAPHLAGLMGKFLWTAYDLSWVHYSQFDERKMAMHRHLLNTEIEVCPREIPCLSGPKRTPDFSVYSVLCCMCNICAGFPDECSMEQVEECLIAMVSHGYYWHLGTVATGIHLARPKHSELTIDKFLSLTSWSGFNKVNQQVILDQLNLLPAVRTEDPLMFFPKSKCRGCSVVAFLITHALWLDFDRGSHFAILGLIHLLKEVPAVGKAVVEAIGPQLVDLAHSIHHVKMPSGDPIAVKRGVFEPVLRLAGIQFYTEEGHTVRSSDPVYEEEQWPPCVVEIREFCLRHVREIKLPREEKERRVLLADALKLEGNALYEKGELESAIGAYTQALDTCPLKCTEKRVTYHSNRAECYLQTNQPRRAIKDCNRALAMNPFNMKVRWRRAQAFQRISYNYPAALDLLTIQGKQEDALKVIGQKTHSELEEKIFNLLDNQNFATAAVHKFGNPSHKGAVQRLAILKPYEAAKTVVAPYRAKTIRQILDQSPGGFQLENDSENEEERPNATTRWAETGGKEAEGDVSEEVRRKMADLNFKWLDREEKFVNPSEKLGGERDLLEERRLLLQQVHKRKTAKLSST